MAAPGLFLKCMDPLFNTPFWQSTWWGNTVFDYLAALLVFAGVVFVLKWTQRILLRYLGRMAKKTSTELDDALIQVVGTIKPPFYTFISFYAALRYLEITGLARKVVDAVLLIWLVYQVVLGLQIFIEYYIRRRMERADDKRAHSMNRMVHSLLSTVLWSVAALFVLSNLGINITSLVAGLGIGGVAVALAAQNVLGDLFSSLAIYFDKPFVPGDFIILGDYMGTVQTVGIKTTRIRSVNGEEIIVSNNEMTSAKLRNYGRMEERRVVFKFGVTYQTTADQVAEIPGMVKKIIEQQENTRYDRVHFYEFGDSALMFEGVYYLGSADYVEYMDTHQNILLAVTRGLEERGVEIAYPTRTVYLKQA